MSIEAFWFCAVAFMLASYVVLDGFDLGAGALHLVLAKNERERRACLRAIGPVWDGNEVWLIAGGGTLLFAFPTLYARSFSGFYLPLVLVLWLLVFRALAIELRAQLDNAIWRPMWDVALAGSSALLALCFGIALGAVVRGVSIGEDGRFFEPLWTDLGVAPPTGVIDVFTLLVGVTALVSLMHHGALWIAMRVDDPVRARAARIARLLWPGVAGLVAATTAASMAVQPRVLAGLSERPWAGVLPIVSVAGLGGALLYRRAGRYARAFVASGVFLFCLLCSVAADLYPYVLPAHDAARSLTVAATAAPAANLRAALVWWLPGLALVLGYFAYAYRNLSPVHCADAAEH